MGPKCLMASWIAVLSRGHAAGVRAEDKKNNPLTPVRPEDAPQGLRFTGRVEAGALARLSARIAGVVDKVNVDEGDRVKKGQVLIELSAPERKDDLDAAAARLDQANAEVEQAEATLQEVEGRDKTATAELARARAGVKVARAGVEIAQAALRRAQTELEFTRIAAPFDGVVARRTVDVGTTVGLATQGESAPLVTVMRDDPVHVVFDVDERSAPHVLVGASVVIVAPSLGAAVFDGKVTRKAVAFNPDTGTLHADVVLPNPDGKLRPGMFVTVDVTQGKSGK